MGKIAEPEVAFHQVPTERSREQSAHSTWNYSIAAVTKSIGKVLSFQVQVFLFKSSLNTPLVREAFSMRQWHLKALFCSLFLTDSHLQTQTCKKSQALFPRNCFASKQCWRGTIDQIEKSGVFHQHLIYFSRTLPDVQAFLTYKRKQGYLGGIICGSGADLVFCGLDGMEGFSGMKRI